MKKKTKLITEKRTLFIISELFIIQDRFKKSKKYRNAHVSAIYFNL